MRVLVCIPDAGENPPPDEAETVETARAIADALASRGHETALAPFHSDPAIVRAAHRRSESRCCFQHG